MQIVCKLSICVMDVLFMSAGKTHGAELSTETETSEAATQDTQKLLGA